MSNSSIMSITSITSITSIMSNTSITSLISITSLSSRSRRTCRSCRPSLFKAVASITHTSSGEWNFPPNPPLDDQTRSALKYVNSPAKNSLLKFTSLQNRSRTGFGKKENGYRMYSFVFVFFLIRNF
jgi:hypothetical protein